MAPIWRKSGLLFGAAAAVGVNVGARLRRFILRNRPRPSRPLAIAMGVATGYYTFQPALREIQGDKGNIQGSGSQPPSAQQQPSASTTSTPAPSSKEDGSGI
ncbi:uncharacterized protein APUU_51224S [Aspergillus puulaauensis]|uniref:Uncharacterized protein n=1 Tax=Aspergillus puulaauensis TaxID=1220207 RepID=A0A7R8AR37_9EURO|nr:uncharacterized protein APUU_51224S [Aspergillus puulaauensis]BCS26513.1 hypothetical protein APUU_51224S [Aspergillus puulaauensis]